MNKYYFILLIIVISLSFSCSPQPNTSDKNNKVVAVIGNDRIYLNDIDTILEEQFYQLRLNALEQIINEQVLKLEAQKQHIAYKDFILKEITQKIKAIDIDDIKKYSEEFSIPIVDTENIKSYLFDIKQKERMQFVADSLKSDYNVKIKLQPPHNKTIDPHKLYSHNLTQNTSKVIVYVISDYQCPKCQKVETELKYLYNKYRYNVCFKFVYYSAYIDKIALLSEAAAKQNKFIEMHDLIFENSDKLYQDSIDIKLAKELHLNMTQYYKDSQDDEILKKLIENKEILSKSGIYSTPTFIVNGKIIDDKYAIDYLEDIIKEELYRLHL